ncbi:MAG TPA: hypothetical protein VF544_10095 [Pyrinomonadaceae bacterium]|jgi:hypothetical protein
MVKVEFYASDCVTSGDGGRIEEYLVLGLTRAEIANPSGVSLPSDDEPVSIVHSLRSLAEQDIELVLVLNPETRRLFEGSADALLRELTSQMSALIVLIPRRPAFQEYREDPVYSFMCSASVFKSLLALRGELAPEALCFALLHAMLNGRLNINRVLARQIPCLSQHARSNGEPTSTAMIMPHRGKLAYLERALYFLTLVASRDISVRVGLDEDRPGEYESLLDQYPNVEFFYADPSPVGPYVIRQELANRSRESLLVFHDSDDISCYDRVSTLYAEMCRTGCGMVGSHDLQVDETSKMVWAARYPLDVSAEVEQGNDGALLLGTSMIRQRDFFRAGGFSTDQVIANDTQFLLRAYFILKICNVDSFLYIRRMHSASLTSAPETALGTPLRSSLSQRWNADFRAVKRGEMRLEQSSLRQIIGSANYQFLPLASLIRRAGELNERKTAQEMRASCRRDTLDSYPESDEIKRAASTQLGTSGE